MEKTKDFFQEKNTVLENSKRYLLAVQHLIAMFGATVLVPLLTGFNVRTAIFCAGCGTLLFHFCTKKKVPVFLGSSFAFIPVIQMVAKTSGLAYAQGGIIVAGFIYVLLAYFIHLKGSSWFIKLFPAQVVGPMIIVIGLNLIPTAYTMASGQLIIALVTLSSCLAFQLLSKGFLKQMSIILSILIGYAAAILFKIVDFTPIVQADVFSLPPFTFPKFSLYGITTIAPVVVAVFMEHIGDITTNSYVVGQNFLKDPGLHRTLLGDGLATMFAGFLGGPANTTYGENTGVLAVTKNYDPSILRITAVMAILLSTVGKIGACLQTIPVPVMGGISLVLFSMISLIGVRTLKNAHILWSIKNIFIIGTILILGLGSHFGLNLSIPITQEVSFSGLSLAALVGVVLNGLFTLWETKLSK